MNHAFSRTIRLARCSLTIALILPALLLAQSLPTMFTLYGRVSLPNGAPASRAVVKINSSSGFDRQFFTDDMGRYEIRDLPRGRYFLTAENPADPQQFTDPVEADTSRSVSGRLLVHIYLRLKKEPPGSQERSKATTVSVAEAAQRVPKDARKAFEEALKHRSDHQPDRALASFDRSIQLFPEYFQALAERGHVLIAQGRIEDAAQDFKRALELNSHYSAALRGLGICKFQQGKFADAVQDLESAATAEPDSPPTYLFLGIANFTLDRRESARTALKQALRLDPAGSLRAHVYLAELYIRENRPQEAADELKEYLAASPNAPDAAKLRAVEAQLRAQLPKQ